MISRMKMMMQMLVYLALIAAAICLFATFYMKIESVSDFQLMVSKMVRDNSSKNLILKQQWTEPNSMHDTNQVIQRSKTIPEGKKANSDHGQEELSVQTTTGAQDVIFEIFASSFQNHSNNISQCLKTSELIWSDLPSSTISCSSILTAALNDTDPQNLEILSNATTWSTKSKTHESILNLVKNCTKFLSAVPFQTVPKSQEEHDFPLAYVFVPHRNLGQTIRLFRMMYHPQNAYCISYDAKSDATYIQAILNMASCFPSNVFLNPYPEPIYYTDYTLLRSERNCMRVLANSTIPWRYVQIVSWNDFPLKTNLELVRIAKILNGSQDSELVDLAPVVHLTHKMGEEGDAQRAIPPGGSSTNYLSREFIDFMLTNPLSIAYYEYLMDSKFPEEFYWVSLVHNIWLGAPGGFPGECEMFYKATGHRKPFLSRYQVWEDWDIGKRKCKGKWTNLSCVYGILDMPELIKRMELVAHKMYEEFEPALLYCMEEWFWERVCKEENNLDWKYYQNLPFVKYHHLSKEQKDAFVCTGGVI